MDFGEVLDRAALLTIWHGDTAVRYVHGAVSSFVQGDAGFRRTRYSAIVEPRLARFQLSRIGASSPDDRRTLIMAASTGYCCTNESCKVRIPLFPLRYSAHPRPKGGVDYAYDSPSLETGFPKLDHAQYGLRCVGAGFVYLFDETEGKVFVWRVNEENGQFIELQSKYRSLEGAIGGYRPGQSLPHIWANERSVVHILLTDTLLTERKIRDIESDQDGIRAMLATTIDMKAWAESAPARNTFAASRLGELVEEFRGTDLDFSPWKIKRSIGSAQSLVTGMKAVAPARQIAVVMHDNIALVQDLGGVFHKFRQAMETYNSAPDHDSAAGDGQRYRKMIVAQLIERIYESGYADKAGVAGQDDFP